MADETAHFPFPYSVTDCKFVVVQRLKTNEMLYQCISNFPFPQRPIWMISLGRICGSSINVEGRSRDVVGSRSVIDLISVRFVMKSIHAI